MNLAGTKKRGTTCIMLCGEHGHYFIRTGQPTGADLSFSEILDFNEMR